MNKALAVLALFFLAVGTGSAAALFGVTGPWIFVVAGVVVVAAAVAMISESRR